MFRYKMPFSDALQAYHKYVTTGVDVVEFDDPALNQFYADEAAGLCTITMNSPDSATAVITNDSELEIHYTDPELEFLRRLM